jgi:copper chaperone CopZ
MQELASCPVGSVKGALPKFDGGEKVKITVDPETLTVRVYANSVEELGEVACPMCANYATCDRAVIKECFVPCG